MTEGPSTLSTRFRSSSADTSARPHAAASRRRVLVTRQALLNQLAVLLGGRSAEEIAFQKISTGAQNDLQRATDLARAMVAEYGMSEALGPVAFKGRNRQRFLEVRGLEPEAFAEETARQIDSEIKQLVVDAHTRASDILRDRPQHPGHVGPTFDRARGRRRRRGARVGGASFVVRSSGGVIDVFCRAPRP